MLCCLLSGCASITNPVANGVPVHILPDELLAETKEDYVQIPLTLLRQPPPEVYELAAGDTLGIYIEGILGDAETPPPVNIPDTLELPLSIGYPFPIRQDGTISLPYVGSVQVAGLSIESAEKVVADAYQEKEILRLEDQRILVTLMRPRYMKVLVIRDDSRQQQGRLRIRSLTGLGSSQSAFGGARARGEGLILELPAYQNDVLNALTRSGGLPGLESTNEVIIQRGQWKESMDKFGTFPRLPSEADLRNNAGQSGITRIPMQVRAGESLNIRLEDIILGNGDIVIVRGREPAFFYVGGLIPSGEYPLPFNYDLTVVEAVLKTNGPLLNGGVNTSNLNGGVIASGIGSPSPSQLSVLRKTPGGGQVTIRVDLNEAMRDPRENILVQADDILILQETTDQAFGRYFSQIFRLDLFGRFISRQDAQGTATLFVP